ncbi:unnamed protein product [Leuciscus chuanchicus]
MMGKRGLHRRRTLASKHRGESSELSLLYCTRHVGSKGEDQPPVTVLNQPPSLGTPNPPPTRQRLSDNSGRQTRTEESPISLSPGRMPLSTTHQTSILSHQVHNDVSGGDLDSVFVEEIQLAEPSGEIPEVSSIEQIVETVERTRELRRSQDIEYLEALNRDRHRDQERASQK